MVQVQSTWFPLIDRNPQTFVPSIYAAKAEDFVSATQRIYTSRERAVAHRAAGDRAIAVTTTINAEHAELAENHFLCAPCVLRGFFRSVIAYLIVAPVTAADHAVGLGEDVELAGGVDGEVGVGAAAARDERSSGQIRILAAARVIRGFRDGNIVS